jgi:hypothetical protein
MFRVAGDRELRVNEAAQEPVSRLFINSGIPLEAPLVHLVSTPSYP